MIYCYDLSVRLEYNGYDLRASTPDSEIRMRLEDPFVWDIPITVVDSEKKWSFDDTINITVSTPDDTDKDLPQHTLPTRYFVVDVKNIPAKSEDAAFSIVEPYIDSICVELTLFTNKHNANRQSYQPRIYAAWNTAKWTQHSYQRYEDMVQAELDNEAAAESTDKVKVVKVYDRISIRASVYATLITHLKPDGLHPERWMTHGNPRVEFVKTAIYSALGDEGVESKYFHLFTIVEFLEQDKEIRKLSNAKQIYSKDQIDEMTNALLTVPEHRSEYNSDSDIINRLKNRISQNLSAFTDLTRAEKLVAILKTMKANEYERHGENVELTAKDAQILINLRNGLFHGAGTDSKREQQYWNGVEQLLYISEKILDYFLKTDQAP